MSRDTVMWLSLTINGGGRASTAEVETTRAELEQGPDVILRRFLTPALFQVLAETGLLPSPPAARRIDQEIDSERSKDRR